MEQTQVNEGLTRQELLHSLQEAKLLSPEDFERAGAIEPAVADGKSLARALVAAGLLTSYQAELILNRRFEKLRIANYDVLDKLGVGGMGTVFKARHRRMKRIVALKVLARSLNKDRTFVQRFQREVETIAQLSHPNIVMAYDADEAKAGHFLVMEFVNGPDLATIVQQRGPLSVAEAVDCALQTARGLEYVHARNMIHRDIKPANLLRDVSGAVKVTDLGLARLSSGAPNGIIGSTGLTQAGGILGTADYMPPEQALDPSGIDHRADIYSLGATLHFLLTGLPPYQGQTMMETLFKHQEAPIPSLTAARPDVPAALDDLFRRMLAKPLDERVQSMTEVVRALEAVRASLSDSASPRIENRESRVEDRGSALLDPRSSILGRPVGVEETVGVPSSLSSQTMDLPPLLTQHAAPLKILLVEPSRTQSGIVRRYLQAQDIQQVVAVTSGQEALQAARGDCPDAIISALHLADMDGVQLALQIRAEKETDAPGFVLISSEPDRAKTETLSACGQAILLHKPFTQEELITALSIVTGRPLLTNPEGAAITGLAPAASPASQPAPSVAPSRERLRVLLVDDSTAARLYQRNVLQGLGFVQFVEAANGAQAVAAIAQASDPGHFDLIVTDYNMPHMDGCGLVGYLKETPATASVPILLVTTETDPEKLEAVRHLGVAAVCDKTFSPEVVRGIVDQLFAE